jgi:hypothetical protein
MLRAGARLTLHPMAREDAERLRDFFRRIPPDEAMVFCIPAHLSLKFPRRTADKGIKGWSGVSQPQPDRGPSGQRPPVFF